MIGRFAEGAEHLKHAIEINPANGRAQYLLASSEQAVSDTAFNEVLKNQLWQRDLPAEDLANLHFAAGRLGERAEDFDRAFEHYKAGNTIRKAGRGIDIGEFAATAERITEVFNTEYVTALSAGGSPSDRPVFVLGVPRSGTTLVEQIIASHPEGYGAGELSNLVEMSTLPGIDVNIPYPDRFADLTPEQVGTMAGRYLEDYPDAAKAAARVVDRTPGTAMWLGLVAAMFPNAAIIHCERDPMDTLWSLYAENMFADLPYACDFDTLAVYYGQHVRLMKHWHKALPANITNIRYEDLVSDPQAMIPKVVAAAGLKWDARCMDFHTHDRSVMSNSMWQVRRPMFETSVGKWKRFEAHAGELREALERHAGSE